jgi:hypothetical protein
LPAPLKAGDWNFVNVKDACTTGSAPMECIEGLAELHSPLTGRSILLHFAIFTSDDTLLRRFVICWFLFFAADRVTLSMTRQPGGDRRLVAFERYEGRSVENWPFLLAVILCGLVVGRPSFQFIAINNSKLWTAACQNADGGALGEQIQFDSVHKFKESRQTREEMSLQNL